MRVIDENARDGNDVNYLGPRRRAGKNVQNEIGDDRQSSDRRGVGPPIDEIQWSRRALRRPKHVTLYFALSGSPANDRGANLNCKTVPAAARARMTADAKRIFFIDSPLGIR